MKYELRYKCWINTIVMIFSVHHCPCSLFYFQDTYNITFLLEKLSCAAEILIWNDAVDFLTTVSRWECRTQLSQNTRAVSSTAVKKVASTAVGIRTDFGEDD